jgi:hypothetical protein
VTDGTTTLGELLTHPERFHADDFVYLPFDEVWQLGTRCAVLPEGDLDGTPSSASQRGLACAFGVASAQDVVANTRMQLGDPTPDQLLDALLFHYDHDAYRSFDHP